MSLRDSDSSSRSRVVYDEEGRPVLRTGTSTGDWDNTTAGVRRLALRRLAKDYAELQKDPLPMIAAEPLGEDWFQWHANLMGPPDSPYEDVCFHMRIEVPENYPRTAPKVTMRTYLDHPNVFGHWICLDMLEGQWCPNDPKTETKTDIGYGWTPAYSIQTILVNLQAFLFDHADTSFWAKASSKYTMKSTVSRARVDARFFHCKKCKHKGRKPWPVPLAWTNRLQYMIPSQEHTDIERTKRDMWNFLENVDTLVNQNAWPKVSPMECGSFFSWSMAPWWDEDYMSLRLFGKLMGTQKIKKGDSKLIRALIGAATNFLNAEGRRTPSKSRLCAFMYRIECALDLALNGTTFGERKRGYWSWFSKSVITLSAEVEEKCKGKGKGKSDASAVEAEEVKSEFEDGGKWIDFPVEISDEIEALYCRWQSDLRRPNEFVRIKSVTKALAASKKAGGREADAYTDLAIVCRPRGYHYARLGRKDLTEEEMRARFKPYGSESKEVRIMRINPLRTSRMLCHHWWLGPYSDAGSKRYCSYTDAKTGKKYWRNSVVVDKHRDELNRWWLVVHPLPSRLDLMRTGVTRMWKLDDLEPVSTGKVYKAYLKGAANESDNKHYVVKLETDGDFNVRCVEDASVYQLQREVRTKLCVDLWKEVMRRAEACGSVSALPWDQPKEEEIVALPKMDPRKFARVCPFLDVLFDSDDDLDDEGEDENEIGERIHMDDRQLTEMETSGSGAVASEGFPFQRTDPIPAVLSRVERGRVVSLSRFGALIDIGLDNLAFLDLRQIPHSKRRLDDFVQRWGIAEAKKYWASHGKVAGKSRAAKRRMRRKRRRKKLSGGVVEEKEEVVDTYLEEDMRWLHDARRRVLPKCLRTARDAWFRAGQWLGPFWVDQTDARSQKVELTLRRPLELLRNGEYVKGRVRNVTRGAVFLDVGCQADAVLSAELLEAGLQNRFVFDCSLPDLGIFAGDFMKLLVVNANAARGRLAVALDIRDKPPDSLTLPGVDFDESRAVRHSIFGLLPDDINEYVFQFANRGGLHRLQKVCRLFQRIINERTNLRWELAELKCFHTKLRYDEDAHVVLGLGVVVERYPNTNIISGVTPRLDGFVSNVSYYEYNVTRSVYKQPFGYWLPVYICPAHGRKSLGWIKRCICSMMAGVTKTGTQRPPVAWDPFFVLKIIPALMNSMIVRVMKGQLHESIVALEGYTMCYHMLLAFVEQFPELQLFVDTAIGNFVNDENMRSKKKTPSLGEWIALLAVSNRYVWRDVCVAYLRENFDRHVKWILNANKELLPLTGAKAVSKEKRLKLSFKASAVSMKLCMFHVCFLRLFRFSQRCGTVLSVQKTKQLLDKLHGRPTHVMKERLQMQTKRIKRLATYKDFFHSVGICKAPTDEELFQWLCTALQSSERRGYHKHFWYRPKRKKQAAAVDAIDAKAEEWEDKFFGKATTGAKVTKKKMSTNDQIIASF